MKKSLMFKNALRQARHGFNRPFMVMFETTLHCNMKCGYCAIWQNQQPEDRAVRERVFARMDEAADFGVFAWSFSGGEPLMNPNMPDYIEYAVRKGFYTSMPTNGLALKKCAEACAKLDQLEVSIDTLDREKFAKRRGIDGLPTILDGARSPARHVQAEHDSNQRRRRSGQPRRSARAREVLPGARAAAPHRSRPQRRPHDVEDGGRRARGRGPRHRRRATDCSFAKRIVRSLLHGLLRFYRNDGFTKKFPCRSASHLVNMRPDGSVQFPCAFVNVHRGAAGDAAPRDLLSRRTFRS